MGNKDLTMMIKEYKALLAKEPEKIGLSSEEKEAYIKNLKETAFAYAASLE